MNNIFETLQRHDVMTSYFRGGNGTNCRTPSWFLGTNCFGQIWPTHPPGPFTVSTHIQNFDPPGDPPPSLYLQLVPISKIPTLRGTPHPQPISHLRLVPISAHIPVSDLFWPFVTVRKSHYYLPPRWHVLYRPAFVHCQELVAAVRFLISFFNKSRPVHTSLKVNGPSAKNSNSKNNIE